MNLKEERARLKLTQKQLAERIGVAPNTVARWEQGVNPLPTWAIYFLDYVKAFPQEWPHMAPDAIREPQTPPPAKSGGR